jgi:hypothetical protein
MKSIKTEIFLIFFLDNPKIWIFINASFNLSSVYGYLPRLDIAIFGVNKRPKAELFEFFVKTSCIGIKNAYNNAIIALCPRADTGGDNARAGLY